MTKNQIKKVLRNNLAIFDGVKFKYEGNHIIVSKDDTTEVWSAAEIECIVDVCRCLRLAYYLDKKGFHVFTTFCTAL